MSLIFKQGPGDKDSDSKIPLRRSRAVTSVHCSLAKLHETVLERLNRQVNKFIDGNNIKHVLSVNDACTTDNNGAAIGIIRVIAPEAT
jgi:hypothetical protein